MSTKVSYELTNVKATVTAYNPADTGLSSQNYYEHEITSSNEITYDITETYGIYDGLGLGELNEGYGRGSPRYSFSIGVPVGSQSSDFLTKCQDGKAWVNVDIEVTAYSGVTEEKIGNRRFTRGKIVGSSITHRPNMTTPPLYRFDGIALGISYTGLDIQGTDYVGGTRIDVWKNSGFAMFDVWK